MKKFSEETRGTPIDEYNESFISLQRTAQIELLYRKYCSKVKFFHLRIILF